VAAIESPPVADVSNSGTAKRTARAERTRVIKSNDEPYSNERARSTRVERAPCTTITAIQPAAAQCILFGGELDTVCCSLRF
jgi:hypothetical protein